jgi:hypothetical protein
MNPELTKLASTQISVSSWTLHQTLGNAYVLCREVIPATAKAAMPRNARTMRKSP